MMSRRVYVLPPIDFGWEDLQKVPQELLPELEKAKAVASKCLWEGDMTEGPFLLILPHTDGVPNFCRCFVWKQHNNGSVFIVTEETSVGISWLSEEEITPEGQ